MVIIKNLINSLGTLLLSTYVLQEKSFALDSASNLESRYEIVLRLKELASKGMAAEVVEEINVIDPNFFAQNSLLLFQLKQVCRSH